MLSRLNYARNLIRLTDYLTISKFYLKSLNKADCGFNIKQ